MSTYTMLNVMYLCLQMWMFLRPCGRKTQFFPSSPTVHVVRRTQRITSDRRHPLHGRRQVSSLGHDRADVSVFLVVRRLLLHEGGEFRGLAPDGRAARPDRLRDDARHRQLGDAHVRHVPTHVRQQRDGDGRRRRGAHVHGQPRQRRARASGYTQL